MVTQEAAIKHDEDERERRADDLRRAGRSAGLSQSGEPPYLPPKKILRQ